MQAPGSSQAGSGRVSTRCVCVPACPLRRDFASAGRSPKAVPEKRVAAAPARETLAVRETASAPSRRRARFDGTLQAPGEARKRSQSNGSPQQRGKQQCIARPASKQLPHKHSVQAAQHAANPFSPTDSQPPVNPGSQSRQSIPAAQPVARPSASPGSACLGCRSEA